MILYFKHWLKLSLQKICNEILFKNENIYKTQFPPYTQKNKEKNLSNNYLQHTVTAAL